MIDEKEIRDMMDHSLARIRDSQKNVQVSLYAIQQVSTAIDTAVGALCETARALSKAVAATAELHDHLCQSVAVLAGTSLTLRDVSDKKLDDFQSTIEQLEATIKALRQANDGEDKGNAQTV